MSLDRYTTAEANLRADRWATRHRDYGAGKRKKLAHAKAFFDKYPALPAKQMDLSDYRRENPDFTVKSLSALAGLRTELVKKGIL